MPRTRQQILDDRAETARLIGRRLADRRVAIGLTQQDAAETLGVAQSAIAKMESGRRALTLLEALDLAKLYRISPLDLDPRETPQGAEEVDSKRLVLDASDSHRP